MVKAQNPVLEERLKEQGMFGLEREILGKREIALQF